MSSSLKVQSARFVDYLDPESDSYLELQENTTNALNDAFSGCPGFIKANVTEIRRFRLQRRLRSSGSEVRQDLILNYMVVFRAKEAVLETNKIKEFIDRVVIDRLKQLNVSGAIIDPGYAAVNARRDLLNQTMELPYVCGKLEAICSVCYRCIGFGISTGCVPKCDEDRNEVCVITNLKEVHTTCHCNRNFVPFGEQCVHQDIVIAFVFGSLAVLLLFLLLVIVCKRKPWRRRKKYTVNVAIKPQRNGLDGSERVKMVRFKPNEPSRNEPRRQPPPSTVSQQGHVNFGYVGGSTSSLVKPESRSNYPTMDRRTEASTAVFEDDRLSFESTDVVAPQELREWESFKNYSSSIDKFDFNDASSDSELEDYF